MQYAEENLILIEGKGKKGFEIYEDYMKLFRNGFDLSIDEACDFLGCSYRYFTKNLVNKIKHIRITITARKLILLYGKQKEEDPEILDFAFKRILFDRNDFYRFIKFNTIIEQQYMLLGKELFGDNISSEIRKNLDEYNSKLNAKKHPQSMKMIFQHIIRSIDNETSSVRYNFPENDLLPTKLYSLKELKAHLNIRSDEEVYRTIKKYGARRYLVIDFVRYDINELQDDPEFIIKMDYSTFLDLRKKYDVCKKVLEQSLKFSVLLAQGRIL